MKKIAFLSMGLLACLAFSPPTLAVDIGPKMGSKDYSINSASVQAGTNNIAFMAVGNEASNIFTTYFEQAYGQETVPEQSDHPAASNNEDVKKYLDLENSTGLAAVVEPERRTCASSVMKDTYNDLDPSKTAAGLPFVGAAQHSHQLVWVMKRPGWTVRYLRC